MEIFFIDQEMFIPALEKLKPEIVLQIMSQFSKGNQINFYYHLTEWQNSKGINHTSSNQLTNITTSENKGCKSDQVSPHETTNICDVERINILSILKSTEDGRLLLKLYKEKHELEVCHRNLLCNKIVEFFFKERQFRAPALSSKECQMIAKQIVNLFPTETLVPAIFKNIINICFNISTKFISGLVLF